MEDTKAALIRATANPAFQHRVYQRAYKLAGNETDAENYVREALTRFTLEVNNKTSLRELERIRPLRYVSTILNSIHKERGN